MHDQSDGVVRCLQVNTAIAHQSLGEENWDDKGGAASISHRSNSLPLSLSLFLQFDRSSNQISIQSNLKKYPVAIIVAIIGVFVFLPSIPSNFAI